MSDDGFKSGRGGFRKNAGRKWNLKGPTDTRTFRVTLSNLDWLEQEAKSSGLGQGDIIDIVINLSQHPSRLLAYDREKERWVKSKANEQNVFTPDSED